VGSGGRDGDDGTSRGALFHQLDGAPGDKESAVEVAVDDLLPQRRIDLR